MPELEILFKIDSSAAGGADGVHAVPAIARGEHTSYKLAAFDGPIHCGLIHARGRSPARIVARSAYTPFCRTISPPAACCASSVREAGTARALISVEYLLFHINFSASKFETIFK